MNISFLDDLSRKIVTLLIQYHMGLGFSDIVRLTGKPRETINRRLRTLVELGILEKKSGGRGRKTIYRLSGKHEELLKNMLEIRNIPKLIALDIAQGFMDLIELGYEDEAYAFLCNLSQSFAWILSASILAMTDLLMNYSIQVLRDESISEKELQRRLWNYGFFYFKDRLDFPEIIVTIIVLHVIRLLKNNKEFKSNKDKLFEVCSSIKLNERLMSKGLEILKKRDSSYAKRLIKLMELKGKSIDSYWSPVKEIYRDAAEEFVKKETSRY